LEERNLGLEGHLAMTRITQYEWLLLNLEQKVPPFDGQLYLTREEALDRLKAETS